MGMNDLPGRVMQGLDLFDVVRHIDKKTKRYLALILQDMEEVLEDYPGAFKLIRGIVLDNYNDYTRAVVRYLFGDVETSQAYKKNAASDNRTNE